MSIKQYGSLQVLLFDDDPEALRQLEEEIVEAVEDSGEVAEVHGFSSWEEAYSVTADGSRRFDIIVSDTYEDSQESHKRKQTDKPLGIGIIEKYRGVTHAPIILCSTASMPDGFSESPFAIWADKSRAGFVGSKVKRLLSSGVPQMFRVLREESVGTSADFLWRFVEKHWGEISEYPEGVIERLLRRRMATAIANGALEGEVTETGEVDGVEFFHYPTLAPHRLSLGEIIKARDDDKDIRIVLTPHCHLVVQPGQDKPRAEHVLTVRLVRAEEVAGEKWARPESDGDWKKIRRITKIPPDNLPKPDGRFWFVPGFLAVPNSYADFMKVESVPYEKARNEYESVAVVSQPFAESLQQSFAAFYSTVGVPNLRPASISM